LEKKQVEKLEMIRDSKSERDAQSPSKEQLKLQQAHAEHTSDTESAAFKSSPNHLSPTLSNKSNKSNKSNRKLQQEQLKSPIRIKISLNNNSAASESNGLLKRSSSQESIKINIGELVRKSANSRLTSPNSDSGKPEVKPEVSVCEQEVVDISEEATLVKEEGLVEVLKPCKADSRSGSPFKMVSESNHSTPADNCQQQQLLLEKNQQSHAAAAAAAIAAMNASKQLEAFKRFHELKEIQNKKFIEEIRVTYEQLISEVKFNSGK